MNQVAGNLSIDFLKRCRTITNAFEKQRGSWTISSQLLHVYSEIAEIQESLVKNKQTEMLEEVCDAILTLITMFDLLGTEPERVRQLMENTLHKVEMRAGLVYP